MAGNISAADDTTSRDLLNDDVDVVLERRAKLFRGLADRSRMLILDTLRTGDLTVGDIVERTGLSQSNVSNHLRCLSECGLVTFERDGRFAYYRLRDGQVEELFKQADVMLDTLARGVEGCQRYT